MVGLQAALRGDSECEGIRSLAVLSFLQVSRMCAFAGGRLEPVAERRLRWLPARADG
jgi:hypothetical protein